MNGRYVIGFGLIAIIIVGSIFIYINKEEYFKQEIIISYQDGCKEIYINGQITTDECDIGRQIEQGMLNKSNYKTIGGLNIVLENYSFDLNGTK